MQIAAEAVFDAVAPPRPRAPRADENAAPEAKSFDHHLEEAAPAEPRPSRADEVEDDANVAEAPKSAASEDKPNEADLQAAAPPPTREAPAPPLTLQILADAAASASDESATLDGAPDEGASDEASTQNTAPAQQAAAAAAPVVSAKPQPAKGKASGEAHAAAGDGKAQARPVASGESAPAPSDATAEAVVDVETQAARPEQQADVATDASAGPAAPAPPPDPSTPPPQQTTMIAKGATAPSKMDDLASSPIEGASTAPAAIDPEQAPAPGRNRGEERANQDVDARAADNAAKGDGQKAAPIVAPKDSFTALLAQQENAPAPQASHALGAATGAAQSSATAAAPQASAIAPPTTQVGREVVRRFNGGSTRFELRLDPPELGRVEVKLEVSRDHKVTAIVAADNPQALAELTRHARDLEQALQSAGLELSDEGISFDLSQQREDNAEGSEQTRARGAANGTAAVEAAPVTARALTLDAWRGSRVDLVA